MKKSNAFSLLIIGDLLVILSFVWIGRSSHNLSISDLLATALTALPFLLSWFVITPWFGIYDSQVSRSRQKLVPRLLLGWAVAGPVALLLRSLILGRGLVSGIIPTFALVSLVGLSILVWMDDRGGVGEPFSLLTGISAWAARAMAI